MDDYSDPLHCNETVIYIVNICDGGTVSLKKKVSGRQTGNNVQNFVFLFRGRELTDNG